MVLAASDVSSRYSRRGLPSMRRLWTIYAGWWREKKGNYMVFCPSYQYLHAIEDILAAREASGSPFFYLERPDKPYD